MATRHVAIAAALAVAFLALAAWLVLGARPPAMQSWNMAVGWDSKRRALAAGAEYVSMLAMVLKH